jgi:LPXTG-motif cell wall-anchored protein
MPQRSWPRWVVALTVGTAAFLGGPLAAGAARADTPAAPVITFSSATTDLSVPIEAKGDEPTPLAWSVTAQGDSTSVDLTADYTGISSLVEPVNGCGPTTCTYTYKDVGTGHSHPSSTLQLVPRAGVPVGSTGNVVFSGTSANGTVVGLTVKVTITAGLPKVSLQPNKAITGAKPGSDATVPFVLANDGAGPAPGVTVRLYATAGLTFPTGYSNCVTGPTTGSSDAKQPDQVNEMTCTFDTTLAAGEQYRLSAPLNLGITDQALYEFVTDETAVLTDSPAPNAADAAGTALTLVDDGPSADVPQAYPFQRITVDNTADLVALGDTATGKPGDTVTLTATLRNDGPASVDINFADDQIGVLVDIPKGTTAVKVPAGCSPFVIDGPAQPALGKPVYICEIDRPFQDGEVVHLPFGLKIGPKAPATTTGKVTATDVYNGGEPYDTHKANNTALFTVHVTGGTTGTGGSTGTTGGSGGTGGSGTGGSTGGSTGGTGSTGSSTGGTVTDVSSLAATGSDSNLPLITGAGAAALALGGGLILVALRRRRANDA